MQLVADGTKRPLAALTYRIKPQYKLLVSVSYASKTFNINRLKQHIRRLSYNLV